MRLLQIHLKLQAMPCLAMIERSLASADHGVGAGLEIKIGLGAHRLNNVDNRRKTPCRSVPVGEL